jgi:hypothetical protein
LPRTDFKEPVASCPGLHIGVLGLFFPRVINQSTDNPMENEGNSVFAVEMDAIRQLDILSQDSWYGKALTLF